MVISNDYRIPSLVFNWLPHKPSSYPLTTICPSICLSHAYIDFAVIADWIRPSSCLGVNGEGCPKAIDGNTATSYAPTVKSGRIEFDLGSTQFVDGMELFKHSDAEGNGIKSVTVFTSQDRKSFFKQKKLTSAYAPKNNFERFPLDTAVSARYVRVDFTNYGRHYTSFWSVKFRVAAPGWN